MTTDTKHLSRRKDLLAIISCGAQKIWSRYPSAGPIPAKDAYTSSAFRVSRLYAETFAERWVILSAKYGFLDPDFIIPGNYNITFYQPDAVSAAKLRHQVFELGLDSFSDVAVIASQEYWNRVCSAFHGVPSRLTHVNRGVGFPPLLIKLIRGLLEEGSPFPTTAQFKSIRSWPIP